MEDRTGSAGPQSPPSGVQPSWLRDADPMSLPDGDLAARWAARDRAAFAEAYRRFAPDLFGTAVGLLGDRAAAADVVHDTFFRATSRLGGLRGPHRLRAWLFAILRNQATSEHRSGHDGGSPGDVPGPMADRLVDAAPPADPEVTPAELATLAWAAADGLQARDREVLELSVRGGLAHADLADALGVPTGHAAALLPRMHDRLDRCLGALLVARLGRRDCDALDRLLVGWDGRFSPDVRSQVSRHADSCAHCGERRSALVDTQRLTPALVAPVELLPPDLRARLVASLGRDPAPAGDPQGGDWRWRDDGFPDQEPSPVERLDGGSAGSPASEALDGEAPDDEAPDDEGPDDEAPDDVRPDESGGRFVHDRQGEAAATPTPLPAQGLGGGEGAVPAVPAPAADVPRQPSGADEHRRASRRVSTGVAMLAVAVLVALGGVAGIAAVLAGRGDRVDANAATQAPSGPSTAGAAGTPGSTAGQASSTAGTATTSGPAGITAGSIPTLAAGVAGTTGVPASGPISTTTGPGGSTSSTGTPTGPGGSTSTPPPPAPVIVGKSITPATVFVVALRGCSPVRASVQVTVDAPGAVSGRAFWSPDGGATTRTVQLTRTGNLLAGEIGPFTTPGGAAIVVRVTDEYGQADKATVLVTVKRCLQPA